MLKKLILLILIGGCAVGLYTTVNYLIKETHKNTPLLNCIPKDAALIIEINNPLSFWASISETNLIWEDLKNIPALANFDHSIKIIDSLVQISGIRHKFLTEKPAVFSIHQGVNKLDYLVAFQGNEEEFANCFELIKNATKINYNKNIIYKTNSKNPIYITFNSPFTIISSNENNIQKSISQLRKNESLLLDENFNAVLKTNNKASKTKLYLNLQNTAKAAIPYLQKEAIENLSKHKGWISFDLILKNNDWLLNGIYAANINKNIVAVTKRIEKYFLPQSVFFLSEQSLSIDKVKQTPFFETFSNQCNCTINTEDLNWIDNHVTSIKFGNKINPTNAVFIATKNNTTLIDQISEFIAIDSLTETVNDVKLYATSDKILKQFLKTDEKVYFTLYNNQLILSTLEGFKQLSFEWKKREHTSDEFSYSLFSEKYLAQKANSSYFATLNYFTELIVPLLKTQYKNSFTQAVEKLSTTIELGLQVNQINSKLTHIAIVGKTNNSSKSKVTSGELWEVKLKNTIINSPTLLKNHKSNSLDICVQDSTNTIHLINAAGRIKWSKKIDAPIIGEINQIDIYGNKKYQMIFNTRNKIHIIDINGNYVSGFPIQLASKATSPVSVFDYENNQNYRLWVSCEDLKTYNYSKDGKVVAGWIAPKSNSIITKPYKRFVLNQTDYIYTIDDKGKVYFLNRRGENIYPLQQLIKARNKKVYFQRRATIETSSFIFQDDSTLQIKELLLSDKVQQLALSNITHLKHLYFIDFDNDNLIEYLNIYDNVIELYGPDKSIIKKSTFMTNVENYNKIIKGANNQPYLVIENENIKTLSILDNNLNQLNKNIIAGNKNVAIGDFDSDGKINIITSSENGILKAYNLE